MSDEKCTECGSSEFEADYCGPVDVKSMTKEQFVERALFLADEYAANGALSEVKTDESEKAFYARERNGARRAMEKLLKETAWALVN